MPKLCILCGYPFAGKSTLSRKLVDRFGFVCISVDEINKELGIGLNILKPITQDEWKSTYKIFYERIADELRSGHTVLADAVNYRKKQRNKLAAIAAQESAKPIVLYVKTPLETVKKRWVDNKAKQRRTDVRDDNFNDVIKDFEEPASSEHTITVLNDLPEEELAKLFASS